ncbi:MAG: translation initiation factor IF-3 [Gemmatimonadota bacterium]|nr:MAG: translation initiation factor IF-3 [Gemmatimonadota bacterium]
MQEVTGSSPVSPTIQTRWLRAAPTRGVRAGSGSQEDQSIEKELRINDRIRISPIRVVDEDGEMLGVMETDEARAVALERGLDLVEVAPGSRPPVCRIMDFGKYKYEQNKKDRKARSKSHQQQLKEVKFRPKIEKHDLEVKLRRARKFLEEHNKVKVTMNFRGREVTHSSIGREILIRVAQSLEDIANVETPPRMEGRHMLMLLAPKPGLLKKQKAEDEGSDE